MITAAWIASALLAVSSVTPSIGGPLKAKRALDTNALADQYFGNDAAWYRDRIPYFEISDQSLQDVYYYRWKVFRAHQRDLGERGYITTGKCGGFIVFLAGPSSRLHLCSLTLISDQSSQSMWAGSYSHGPV